ncbi:MAG: prolipoprotein diacylglyceryl transferase [Alphaproteobacteria bacterium]|nr:prolipoprotein diacylglyceryl transferase [Alphaproteobacteria bacterium]
MYSGVPFPDIDPVIFQIGFFSLRWYSLAYIVGIIGAWFLARRMSEKKKSVFTVLKIDDFLVWATVGIILGGRLGYVFFYNASYYLEFPLKIFALWQGGMSFHGGLLGVIVAACLFAKKRKIPLLEMSDILVCVAPFGLFLGRLANFSNGELFGRVTHSVPWAIIFPDGGPEPRHPSQLYEAALEGVVLFLILNGIFWFSKRLQERTGFLTGLFFFLYGVFRFVLEYTREPDGHLGFIWQNLSMGQILSIPMVLFGIYLIKKSSFKNKLKKIDI